MGLLDWLWGKGRGRTVEELARRLDVNADKLRTVQPTYTVFTVPKRSGGVRKISSPSPELKAIQRRLLRRVLQALPVHTSVTGFVRGHSIVTNALHHVGKRVVVRMDVQDFFPATGAERVRRYFRKIGWNREAADLLTKLCTYEGGLPQGAPTSPCISNVVNFRMDARLAGLAARYGAVYTRYADDLTFSFEMNDAGCVRMLIRMTKESLKDEGYRVHHYKKLRVRRSHQRQIVTGLVVNEKASLPRDTRRWLRAVDHYAAVGRGPTLLPAQRQGWKALQSMVENQRAGG